MGLEIVGELGTWSVMDLYSLLASQNPTGSVSIVISDGETGEVFGTSKFTVLSNGDDRDHLILSGIKQGKS